jgi:hypothetical protein
MSTVRLPLILGAALASTACLDDTTTAPAPSSCTLPAPYEVLSTGHIVADDMIVGSLDEFQADCAAGRRWRGLGDGAPGTRSIGVRSGASRWPGGRVPYRIDPTLPEADRVTDAIAHWEQETALDFVPRTANDADYVYFTNGDRCSSDVGRVGGRQDVLLSTGKSYGDIAAMAISRAGDTFTWYRDGMVSAGTSTDLDAVRVQYPYALPTGYTASQIVGMAIGKDNGRVYTWFDDGRRSAGTSADLDAYQGPIRYYLPPGKSASQIVGIDLALDGDVYTWYSDGTRSVGTTTDLDAVEGPIGFLPAAGRTVGQLVGLAIAPADGDVYAWYSDGTRSIGSSLDLDADAGPIAYAKPSDCDLRAAIHEIGHAVGLKHEQGRSDRAFHVRVFPDEIKVGKEDNFDIYSQLVYQDIGAYDLDSIMHYPSYNFTVDGSPTLLALVDEGEYVPRADVADLSISMAGEVYTWWTDGTVTAGTSTDLELHRSRYDYVLPDGYGPTDLVGVAISKNTGDTYAFYRDGTRSIGSTSDLAAVSGPVPFEYPSNYTPDDIIAIDLAPNGRVYTWWDDGKVSSGTSTDLTAYTAPTRFSYAPGKTATAVLGIAISVAGDTFVWHTGGDVSAGTTTDHDAVRPLEDFRSRLEVIVEGEVLSPGDLAAIDFLY